VIAHEIGHHVQNLLGVSGEVRNMQSQAGETERNRLSVRLELQADCFAGVWANRSRNIILDEGDIDEALNAAAAIGDDQLQRQGRGTVTPDSFTHGSSAQRRQWFQVGMEQGEPERCDTFSAKEI
jgi:predicted metalloprotease